MTQNDATPRPRALIVDDDNVLRLAIQQFITRQGFKTSVAGNGEEGLEQFRRERPDIVLVDAAMPVMDGFATCEAIRALPEGADVPIIMITIYEDEQSVDHAFEAGASEFINKPIHWAVLRNRIQQLVQTARAERDLRNERAFFQSMVDSVPDPIVVWDRSGAILWVNASARACGFVRDCRAGKIFSFAPGIEAPDLDDHPEGVLESWIMQEVVRAGTTVNLLVARPTAGQGPQYADLQASPLRGVEGKAQGVILRLHDVTVREREGRRLRAEVTHFGRLAYQDSLTGLPNRLLFAERLNGALQGSVRAKRRVALLYIDLDGFKDINDRLGHEAGDQVLKAVAERLQDSIRHSDTVARLGGDEFAALLLDVADDATVEQVARKMLDRIREPVPIGEDECRLSASIGISLYPDHASSGTELLQRADTAMYQVKNDRKDGIAIYRRQAGRATG